MVVKIDSSMHTTKYNFNRKAGKSIIDHKPIFSPDGESVLIIVENVVRVYNIQTGDCSRVIETESAVKELVNIQFPENDVYNLYGCSDSGLLTVWTWENGTVLKEMNLLIPSETTVLSFDIIDSNEGLLIGVNKSNILYLASYSIKTGSINYEYKATKIEYFRVLSVSLGWCDGDRYAAVSNGTNKLFIQNLYQPHLRTEIINHNHICITSVAADPTQSAVSVTDALGRVTIIRGYLYNYNNLSREVMHWHYLPPLASCFPSEGSYLLTGGMETVLVKWTVGNLANKAQEKQFIPRLPGMIRHISTNNSHIAVSLTNNSVVIASGQMRVVSTILECGGLSPAAQAFGTSLVYHRGLAALLLGGRTGHLQLFSTTNNKVLYNIDVTQMNKIPSTRDNLLPLELEVTCAAVSSNGSCLVTSEYRNDNITYPEERLKFWSMQENGATPFKLNTCVNLSHGGFRIVSLALNNSGDFCVSGGSDQKFRIWKRVYSDDKKTTSWKCLTACYYSSGSTPALEDRSLNDFKNSTYISPDDQPAYLRKIHKGSVITKLLSLNKTSLIDEKVAAISTGDMGGVSISQDGSLIAAWFGSKLTLWDTHACNIRTTLSHPALKPKGLHVQFGNGDAAHYLVCTTKNCVAVWSLLSLSMKWIVYINPSCLTADPFSNKMAVITKNNDVYVFSPHSSTPILKRERLLNPNTGLLKQCTFGASSGDDVRLYMMRNDSEIYCLEPEQTEEIRLEVVSSRNLPSSNFSALLAEQHTSEVKSVAPTSIEHLDTDGLGNTAISQFLSAAPHMMPPVNLLCTSFLEHISGRKEVKEPQENDQIMDVDEESSDDEEPVTTNGSYAPKTELWTPIYDGVKEKRLYKYVKEPILDSGLTLSLFGT